VRCVILVVLSNNNNKLMVHMYIVKNTIVVFLTIYICTINLLLLPPPSTFFSPSVCLSHFSCFKVLCYFFINKLIRIFLESSKHILNIQHLNYQPTPPTLKNADLLKHFKISKTAPTCFGLQGNHHQGTTATDCSSLKMVSL